MTEDLARTRSLTTSRLEPVFLTLRRNRDFWMRRALPRPGVHMHFGRDPVVFQYYAGRGLQVQPLASFGRANALARSCLSRRPRHICRLAALRRLLGRMVDFGAERGGFLAWEHYLRFGGGRAPWISAMTQGTGAQALARGGRALGEPRFITAARRAWRVRGGPADRRRRASGSRGKSALRHVLLRPLAAHPQR